MNRVRVVGWGLAAAAVAGWLALVEVFWLPFRLGGLVVPLSVLAAVVGNVLLVRTALRVSGSRLVAALPALVWLAVVIAAMSRRPEGDLVMTSGGATGVVNLAFLMLGVLAAAFSVGQAVGTPRRPVSPAPAPCGSGTGGAR